MDKNNTSKTEKETNEIKLVFSNPFGRSYFIASIAMIIICIVFAIIIGTSANPLPLVWVLLSLSLIYCLGILFGELVRSGVINRFKKHQNKAK